MPVILDEHNAISIIKLMEFINTRGIKWHIISKSAHNTIFVRGISTLRLASSYDISFLQNYKYLNDIHNTTDAHVVIVEEELYKYVKNIQCFIVSDNAYLLYTRIAQWFNNFIVNSCSIERNIDHTSIISSKVSIGKNVTIGSYCVIEENVEIGDNNTISAFSFIGSGVQIGNNVEIGANTTIDRGSLDNTVISDGVKIDNQVMIGHNVTINESTAIAACVGIASSTTVGKRCTIGKLLLYLVNINIVDDVHIAVVVQLLSQILLKQADMLLYIPILVMLNGKKCSNYIAFSKTKKNDKVPS